MAVAALVLGILATVFSLIPAGFMLGVPMAIIALILGVVGRKQAATNNLPTGTATAGMVLGIVGLVIGVAMWVVCAQIAQKGVEMGNEFEREMQKSREKIEKDEAARKLEATK